MRIGGMSGVGRRVLRNRESALFFWRLPKFLPHPGLDWTEAGNMTYSGSPILVVGTQSLE